MPDDQLEPILEMVTTLARKAAAGGYIFRGEPICHDLVSSSLYRAYSGLGVADFDIEVIQQQMLDRAMEYLTGGELSSRLVNRRQRSTEYRSRGRLSSRLANRRQRSTEYRSRGESREILNQLQHYGGKTNLIDFTTDYLVALFFACDGGQGKDGRVVLLPKAQEPDAYTIWQPHSPAHRVIAQKSIFVEPAQGFVEIEMGNQFIIPSSVKQALLSYLDVCHGISARTIYNDLHGFIRQQDAEYGAISSGVSCLNVEDYQGAIESFSQALAFNPQDAFAYNDRGVAYHKRGDYPRSIQDYTRAIDLNPNYAEAYYNRGESWLHLGEWDKARADLNVALNKGADIVDSFHDDYDNVAAFEQQHSIEVPPDLAEMLGG